MPNDNQIVVRSHVGRDLLQSAALFKTDRLVIWEYVSNSLQYVEPGKAPEVYVSMDAQAKRITISDNGRGLDREGLQNFFVMHGENLDRKLGRKGRGRFGTGKSAAFGIADCLRVTSVKDGRRNSVELCRADVERAGERNIPVRVLEHDSPIVSENGTTIEINDVKLRHFDQPGVIRFIERHLARWPNRPTVVVNNRTCEYSEPPVSRSEEVALDGEEARVLRTKRLLLNVSKVPLEPDFQGVSILCDGVWFETTLAGAEGQHMANYIFGEIDIPSLDDDSSPIAAFDMSRSMRLNANNPVVMVAIGVIGREVDRLRRQLVKEDSARRAADEVKKMEKEANRIAEIINEDFRDFSGKVAKVKVRSKPASDLGKVDQSTADEPDLLVVGGDLPGEALGGTNQQDGGIRGTGGGTESEPQTLCADEGGAEIGRPTGGEGAKRRPRGGFSVDFEKIGADQPRNLSS